MLSTGNSRGMRHFLAAWLGMFLTLAALPTPAGAQTVQWTRQFGSTGNEGVNAVAVDATGVYVVGTINGALPGQTSGGLADSFVRKYNTNGTEQWTRQFGSTTDDGAYGVAVDSTGVYVVGYIYGTLPGQTSAGFADAYVRKYDANGNIIWTRQFGSTTDDGAGGVAVDSTGVYVVGRTNGALPGQTSAGACLCPVYDAFVRKYDANGTEQWTRQFGSAGDDEAHGVAVDSTGVYVVGRTNGALPG